MRGPPATPPRYATAGRNRAGLLARWHLTVEDRWTGLGPPPHFVDNRGGRRSNPNVW
jgi:hypothetical protein